MLTPYGETPARPSIIIRKQTHRLQNVAAAAALIVIVLLIVLGKRSQSEGVSLQDAARALPSTAPRTTVVVPATTAKRGMARTRASAEGASSSSPSASSSASPPDAGARDE